jgi:hypothetical protein
MHRRALDTHDLAQVTALDELAHRRDLHRDGLLPEYMSAGMQRGDGDQARGVDRERRRYDIWTRVRQEGAMILEE